MSDHLSPFLDPDEALEQLIEITRDDIGDPRALVDIACSSSAGVSGILDAVARTVWADRIAYQLAARGGLGIQLRLRLLDDAFRSSRAAQLQITDAILRTPDLEPEVMSHIVELLPRFGPAHRSALTSALDQWGGDRLIEMSNARRASNAKQWQLWKSRAIGRRDEAIARQLLANTSTPIDVAHSVAMVIGDPEHLLTVARWRHDDELAALGYFLAGPDLLTTSCWSHATDRDYVARRTFDLLLATLSQDPGRPTRRFNLALGTLQALPGTPLPADVIDRFPWSLFPYVPRHLESVEDRVVMHIDTRLIFEANLRNALQGDKARREMFETLRAEWHGSVSELLAAVSLL